MNHKDRLFVNSRHQHSPEYHPSRESYDLTPLKHQKQVCWRNDLWITIISVSRQLCYYDQILSYLLEGLGAVIEARLGGGLLKVFFCLVTKNINYKIVLT